MESRIQHLFRLVDEATEYCFNIESSRPLTARPSRSHPRCASPQCKQPMTTQLTIDISTSPLPDTAAGPTFDANHGANRTKVFAGRISLPQESDPGSWPAQ